MPILVSDRKNRDDLQWFEIGKIPYDELEPYPATRVGLQYFPSSTFPTFNIYFRQSLVFTSEKTNIKMKCEIQVFIFSFQVKIKRMDT